MTQQSLKEYKKISQASGGGCDEVTVHTGVGKQWRNSKQLHAVEKAGNGEKRTLYITPKSLCSQLAMQIQSVSGGGAGGGPGQSNAVAVWLEG